MTHLQRDIQSIIETVASGEKLRLGVLESANGHNFTITAGSKPDQIKQAEVALGYLFDDADQDARIALAYMERSPRCHCGAWASVADKFCPDDIAGVFILEKDRGMTEMASAERFLDLVPDILWKAGLPILFDEIGVLEKYSPNSRILECDERLSFKDLEEMLDPNVLASIGGWSKGFFPVYDVSGTDAALKYVRELSDFRLDSLTKAVHAALLPVNCWNKRWNENGGWDDIEVVMLFLEIALPGSTDPSAIAFLNELEYPEKEPFAIGLAHNLSPELVQVDRFADQVLAVAKLIKEVLVNFHIKFNPRFADNFQLCAEDLHDLLYALGVQHQLEALKLGVPLEDVVA